MHGWTRVSHLSQTPFLATLVYARASCTHSGDHALLAEPHEVAAMAFILPGMRRKLYSGAPGGTVGPLGHMPRSFGQCQDQRRLAPQRTAKTYGTIVSPYCGVWELHATA